MRHLRSVGDFNTEPPVDTGLRHDLGTPVPLAIANKFVPNWAGMLRLRG
jgi:hypothetical protein